ncbi:MAG: hypothetical protein HC822_08180 [Oscillochloris sp.]|nr:hypothetical protein [Oscillochloris sp.]
MYTVQIETVRRWAQVLGLGVLLAITLILVLAVVLPAAALVLALALIAATVLVVARQVRTVAQTAQHTAAKMSSAAEPVPATLQLELADGSVLQGRPVVMPGRQEHTMVLTREGYLLVDAEGAIRYRL